MATIEKRNGSYKITVSCGYDATGRQIRRRMTWTPDPGMTARQIEKELNRQATLFEEKVRTGARYDGGIKFADFIDIYFRDYGNAQLKTRTQMLYKDFSVRVKEKLGHLRLDRIAPNHLLEFYADLSKPGNNQRTGGGLSPKSIRNYHAFISSIFERAVKWGYIGDNVARRVDAPQARKAKIQFLDETQIQTLIEELDKEALVWRTVFYLLILTGARRGEVMGLEWPDIDLGAGTIAITRTSQYDSEIGIYTDTPKTEGSARTISIAPELVAVLRQYKAEQAMTILSLGDSWWPGWKKQPRLFTSSDGHPMHPNMPYNHLKRILKRCGLPQVSIHSLRHTNASLMIRGNTDVRTVAGRLGHSQTSTTLNIYAEFLQSADKAASDSVSNAIFKRGDDEKDSKSRA